jgi:PPOX class probable F420-dependent enzyme
MAEAPRVRRLTRMLDEKVTNFARKANFAAVTTLGRDGTPMTQPMWVDTDGEHLIMNTEVGRQKFANIKRDPRITVTIIDAENPYEYVEVRGKVVDTKTGPEARSHIDELAKKYMGVDEYPLPIQTERVIITIAPDRQVYQ